MDGEKKKLITLLVISNVLLFGAGLYIGLSSSNLEGRIRVYKMEREIVPVEYPIFGPNYIEINGTFRTNDGVFGSFPSESVRWNGDVFNITISPSAYSTHFIGQINITAGEGIWYFEGWLTVIGK